MGSNRRCSKPLAAPIPSPKCPDLFGDHVPCRLARFKLRAHLSREFFDGANLR
jgi:hypothetical protein